MKTIQLFCPVQFLNRNRAPSPRVDVLSWKLFNNREVKGPTCKRFINILFLLSLLVSPLALDEGGEVNVSAIILLLNYSKSFEVETAAVVLAPALLSRALYCSHFPRELSSGKHKIIGESLI